MDAMEPEPEGPSEGSVVGSMSVHSRENSQDDASDSGSEHLYNTDHAPRRNPKFRNFGKFGRGGEKKEGQRAERKEEALKRCKPQP